MGEWTEFPSNRSSRKDVSWNALDFRPSEVQMQENEYAGPPKRSRKLPIPPTAPVISGYVTEPFTQPPPHVLPPVHLPNAVSSSSSASTTLRYPVGNHATLNPPPFHQHSRHHAPPPHSVYHPHYYPAAPYPYASAPAYETRPVSVPGQVVAERYRAGQISTHPHSHASFIPPFAQQALGYTAPRPMVNMASQGGSMGAPPSQGGQVYAAGHRRSGSTGRRSGKSGVPPVGGHVELGLDRMNKLMAGLPPLRIPAIHLAGTNGKGSVSALLESCLMAAGFRVLRYNSPFLVEPRDAVRINGEIPSAAEYAAAVATVERVRRAGRVPALPFELTTAAAFLIASQAQPPIDIMIVECGMGGVRDCTNVLAPELTLASVLTTVGLDHTDRIGETITEIAQEKTGIAVPGGLLIVGAHLPPDAMAVAQQTARDRNVALIQARPGQVVTPATGVSLRPFRAPEPAVVRIPLASQTFEARQSLPGGHQADNLALAVTVLDVVRQDKRALRIVPRLAGLSDADIRTGTARTQWAGRCSWLEVDVPSPRPLRVPILADGAHNEDSSATLRSYIESLKVPGRRTYLISLSHNTTKTPESILAPLLAAGDRVAIMDFTTPVAEMPWIHVCPRAPLRAAVEQLIGPSGELYEAPASGPAAVMDALKWATRSWADDPGLIVFAGSLYFVADLYRIVDAQQGRPARL